MRNGDRSRRRGARHSFGSSEGARVESASISPTLDQSNADFWRELSGGDIARASGVSGTSAADLDRFDAAYLRFYPYLAGYVPGDGLAGQRVLEIGLGYGTLGQLLADRGAAYLGVDISPGPVDVMRYRLQRADRHAGTGAARASALELPVRTGSYDLVVSIGCLHHTGDLRRAVSEVRRVLRDGGQAVVMLYNRRSLRQIAMRARQTVRRWLGRPTARTEADEKVRALYDRNSEGQAAPHTDFVSTAEVRELFRDFRSVTVDRRNIAWRRVPVPRSWLLATRVDRAVGLDLYVCARA